MSTIKPSEINWTIAENVRPDQTNKPTIGKAVARAFLRSHGIEVEE